MVWPNRVLLGDFPMNVVDVSRWQFGLTTLYHFIFVPLTIGMALIVAILQTVWVRTGK